LANWWLIPPIKLKQLM